MQIRPVLIALSIPLLLASCATQYQPSGLSGGFRELRLNETVYRVSFSGNGYATYETVQTYWLYRCAELALQNGFGGFEILSDVRFLRDDSSPGPVMALSEPVRLAAGGRFVYVPVGAPAGRPKSSIVGDIHLIPQPDEPRPPKIFDAARLKSSLEAFVMGDKCNGNVCPHVHAYLLAPGTLDEPPVRYVEKSDEEAGAGGNAMQAEENAEGAPRGRPEPGPAAGVNTPEG